MGVVDLLLKGEAAWSNVGVELGFSLQTTGFKSRAWYHHQVRAIGERWTSLSLLSFSLLWTGLSKDWKFRSVNQLAS